MSKKFISIIWGYHKQLYNFPKEQNYHIHALEVAQSLGYNCEVISLDETAPIENDPNFPGNIGVKRPLGIIAYLLYILKNRDALFYVNTLTLKTLVVGMLVRHSIFIPHDSIFGSTKLKGMIIRFFYRFFTKIRVNNSNEQKAIDTIRKNLASIVPLVVARGHKGNPHIQDKKLPFTFLSLGNLIPKKDPELLLKALSHVVKQDYKVKLIVIGEDRLKQSGLPSSYGELIKKYQLENIVKHLGYIPASEIEHHIQDTLAYINTSHFEGMCLAVYDAAFLGKGLILPDILSFDGIFGENAYYYPDGNAHALSKVIITCIQECDTLQKKVQAIQEHIDMHLNYEVITQNLGILFTQTHEQ